MDIIVDIDGTLADLSHRLHFIADPKKKDWDGFFAAAVDDKPIGPVVDMVLGLSQSCRLVIVTGRPEWTRNATQVWLRDHAGLNGYPLYMRATEDRRDDSIVKLEILKQIRADGYRPELAIDDRKRVVAMWRKAGITCAQVADGDY